MAPRFDPYCNFSVGEISPLLRARVDLDAFRSGLKTCRNFQPLHTGGIRARHGTEFVRDAIIATGANSFSRLIPYIVSVDEAYMLELSHLAMRVHNLNDHTYPSYSGSWVDLTTPWSAADLADIKYAQRGNFMVFVHQNYAPRGLFRRGADWPLSAIAFFEKPTQDNWIELSSAGIITIPNATGSQTATASSGRFLAGDVGRTVSSGPGFGTITAVASATSATILVQSAFSVSGLPWLIGGAPKAFLTTAASGSPSQWDSVVPVHREGELVTFRAIAGGGVASSVDAFRATDVGSVLTIGESAYRIESMSAGSVATTVLRSLPETRNDVQAWYLRRPLWGGIGANPQAGYPSCVTFIDQRMVLAGFPGAPSKFVGSVVGDILDFTAMGLADDGYSWDVLSDQSDRIHNLLADNDLLLMTESAEYAAAGGDFSTITAVDIPRIRPQTTYGSLGRVRPVKVGRDHVFVQRDARSIMAMRYEIQLQGYETSDLTVLAPHITEGGVKELAYQRRPIPTLYAVLNSGQMACCTLDPKQGVTAWWKWVTAGFIESVAVVPYAQTEQVWMVVRRFINGAYRLLIERVQDSWIPIAPSISLPAGQSSSMVVGYQLDCARRAAGVVFPGLSPPYSGQGVSSYVIDHLRNMIVNVVLDGAAYPTAQTVPASGSMSLPMGGYEVVVGLGYSALAEPMPSEVPTGAGSGLGRQAHASETSFILHNSVGGTFNGQDAPLTQPNLSGTGQTVHNFRADEINGHHKAAADGWVQDTPLWRIERSKPLPMHVLAVVQKVTANP